MCPPPFNLRPLGNPHACAAGSSRFAGLAACCLVALVATGCARLGEQVGRAALPPGAPSAPEVLADLAANDEAIRNFRGAGTFILVSPDLRATQKFRGSIRFRRPSDLYVQGNHRLTNITLFRLSAVGREFVMEFPGSKEDSFYQLEGDIYEDVDFSVSPSDVAREMFLSEDWGAMKQRDARIVDFEADTGRATLRIGRGSEIRRLVDVLLVDDGDPTWVVMRNRRLNADGAIIADIRLEGYNRIDDALFPTEIDAWFPSEETRMTFQMRNIRINTELDAKYFDIQARVEALGLVPRNGG